MMLKLRSSERVNIDKEKALKEVTKEEMVTLTLLVPESIRTTFKTKAIRNRRTIRGLILGWIKKYLEEGK